MMDRDSSIDSNLSNNTGKDRPARKSTIHDLYASREKHRAKSVKACRATAEQIIHNSNAKISNMDVLFRHEVSKDRCWIWPNGKGRSPPESNDSHKFLSHFSNIKETNELATVVETPSNLSI